MQILTKGLLLGLSEGNSRVQTSAWFFFFFFDLKQQDQGMDKHT